MLKTQGLSPLHSQPPIGFTNFFGRFDPHTQLFENPDDMNLLACVNTMNSGFPDVTEHMTRVLTPPSEHDLHSQNLHAEGGPVFRFDSEAGPSDPQGNYRSQMNTPQMEANA